MNWFRGALVFALACFSVGAAEHVFELESAKPGELPAGWRPLLAGQGKPGEWKVAMDEVPATLKSLTPDAPNRNQRPVLAQLSRDPRGERFPLLVWGEERYGDFTFAARFKIVDGALEQIAGIAFRVQDEKNFYVARVSVLGGNLRFYKFVNGQYSQPIGPERALEKGTWHELAVECLGNRIQIRLDGKDAMPAMTDNSFATGMVGLMTKSDSIAYFADLRITYRPLESLASYLVRTTMQKNPRLLNLRIYGHTAQKPDLHVMASSEATEIGEAGTEVEQNVISMNQPYYGKVKDRALVTYPLHDRNGEAIGAVKFTLKSFKGETEANALGRVTPIVQSMQKRIAAARNLEE
jgi:hypothetical protein